MVKKDSGDDRKLFAFLAIFLTIIGFLIALAVKKNDKYVMFYAKQGLVLFFGWIIVWAAGMILAFLPIIGWLTLAAGYILMLVFWAMGIVYSLSGEMKEIPVIGVFANKINI